MQGRLTSCTRRGQTQSMSRAMLSYETPLSMACIGSLERLAMSYLPISSSRPNSARQCTLACSALNLQM